MSQRQNHYTSIIHLKRVNRHAVGSDREVTNKALVCGTVLGSVYLNLTPCLCAQHVLKLHPACAILGLQNVKWNHTGTGTILQQCVPSDYTTHNLFTVCVHECYCFFTAGNAYIGLCYLLLCSHSVS